MGDDPAAGHKRRDKQRVAPVAGLGRPRGDVLDDRRKARLAQPVRPGGIAIPAGGHHASRRAGRHDPCGIEAQELAEQPARRVVAQCGQDTDAAAGVDRRPGLDGASRHGRRIASQPWKHDSQEARRLVYRLASPERGNQVKIT